MLNMQRLQCALPCLPQSEHRLHGGRKAVLVQPVKYIGVFCQRLIRHCRPVHAVEPLADKAPQIHFAVLFGLYLQRVVFRFVRRGITQNVALRQRIVLLVPKAMQFCLYSGVQLFLRYRLCREHAEQHKHAQRDTNCAQKKALPFRAGLHALRHQQQKSDPAQDESCVGAKQPEAVSDRGSDR